MGSNCFVFLRVAVFLAVAGLAAASFISDSALRSHESTGRSLLQAKKNCPINFEGLNYTIITSRCKGPQYPANICCDAFKQFACPYADSLNDITNNCAATMFSYIQLYGKYPAGLFANECREGNNGLHCPADPPHADAGNGNSSHGQATFASLVAVASGFVLSILLS